MCPVCGSERWAARTIAGVAMRRCRDCGMRTASFGARKGTSYADVDPRAYRDSIAHVRRVRETVAAHRRTLAADRCHGHAAKRVVLDPMHGVDRLHLRIGKEILGGVADQYRKLRNTFRYLLGALDGFDEAERVPVAGMPELPAQAISIEVATPLNFIGNKMWSFRIELSRD